MLVCHGTYYSRKHIARKISAETAKSHGVTWRKQWLPCRGLGAPGMREARAPERLKPIVSTSCYMHGARRPVLGKMTRHFKMLL